MAGHSQFKNIMHRKGAQDAKRARMFAKIAREIFVCAKAGIADPALNPRLRAALASARAVNMPKDNIERALKKAAGNDDHTHYEEVRYEGYGPGGVAFIVETLTDNRNRTASDIRSIFTKNGGHLGESGSVSYFFERIGIVIMDRAVSTADDIFERAASLGAENIESDDDCHLITCSMENFATLRDHLSEFYHCDPQQAKIVWKALVPFQGPQDHRQTILKMMDALEDLDDVQDVFTNADVHGNSE